MTYTIQMRLQRRTCWNCIMACLTQTFYNGKEDQPEEQVLRLSDAFAEQSGQNGRLELEVRVVNINTDKKHGLLEKCGTLRQYSEFVEKTRQFGGDKDKLEKAVKECIQEDILAGYLRRKSEEVINMLMAEYDYETDLAVHCEEAEARGKKKGKVEVYYTEMHLSVDAIAEKLSMTKENVRKILTERGFLKEEIPV